MNKGVLLVLGAWACAGSTHGAGGPPPPLPPQRSPAAQAAADNGRPKYTAADVHFISGMIGHHAQAVLMAGGAPPPRGRPSRPPPRGRGLGPPPGRHALLPGLPPPRGRAG